MDIIVSLLSDYTFRTVALGAGILGIISGVLGSFSVLRKQSLLGDGVSHSALPGVVAAFLITGSKRTEILLLGALISGALAVFIIIHIVKYSRVKFDSALALTMSVFFGLGMVLLTYSQKIPNANQAGLNRFIFGQASTLLKQDVLLMIVCGGILLILVALFWKEFKILSFDTEFAMSIGLPVKKLNLMLSFMTVIGIIMGLQTVGVILMSAMLIAPAAAARQWTNKLHTMVIISAFFGAFSGFSGTVLSSMFSKMPTGPCIVIAASIIVIISILFSPLRGLVPAYYRQKKQKGGKFNDASV